MGVDAVALANQFVAHRLSKNTEGALSMAHESIKYTTPTMTGCEVNEGIDKVKAFWAKQDKDLPTVVDKTDFAAEGNSATRKLTIKKMMMHIKLQQTFTFNDDGKLIEHVTKKM